MNKLVRPYRIVLLIIALALVLTIYGGSLYKLQLLSDSSYADETTATTSSYISVTAARGSILDRNGEVLVSDNVKYNVGISRSDLLEMEDPNAALLKIIQTAREAGVEYRDTLPISYESPFEYVKDMTDSQKDRYYEYLEFFELDQKISASDFMIWLMKHYDIDYTISFGDARRITGVRYELELRAVTNAAPYYFAENVDMAFITTLLEQDIPCVNVESSTVREYSTKYAAHILGYTGLMTAEEYNDTYELLDYPMDATVGKDGVELAFENYLHPTNGSIIVTRNAAGKVVDVSVSSEAKGGNNVFLSIDIGMQAAAEEALASQIQTINATRKVGQDLADAGAVVVTDVNSGETLVAASYPTYDLSRFYEEYPTLVEDPAMPLMNRATYGEYEPGSTFKMVSAFAGLTVNQITRYTTVTDQGRYMAYEDYQPTCWIYPENHGTLDVVGALANSCNYFFYWLSDNIGIRAIDEAAALFGLGEKTGIETGESLGQISTPEYKLEVFDESWWAGDTLQSAIGQGFNLYTPIQLANYIGAIANNGTIYKATLLDKVMTSDMSAVVYQQNASVLKTVPDPNNYISILQEGMRAVATDGTASSTLADYPIPVAAKTGTVQSASSTNTGVFVCYAPYDNPQIAISVVVEHGGSGSGLVEIAREILDYYFSSSAYSDIKTENVLS